jgi:hypothetical protein
VANAEGLDSQAFSRRRLTNEVPAIRDRFVNGFANRADYFDWLVTPGKAEAYLEHVAS